MLIALLLSLAPPSTAPSLNIERDILHESWLEMRFRAAEDARCPAECRAHLKKVRALRQLACTWPEPLDESVVGASDIVIRLDYFAGFRGNRAFEIQRVGGRALVLTVCDDELACPPISRFMSERCWQRVDAALTASSFWSADELVSPASRRERAGGLDNPMIIIDGLRGSVHRRFMFHHAVSKEREPGDQLFDGLWNAVYQCR